MNVLCIRWRVVRLGSPGRFALQPRKGVKMTRGTAATGEPGSDALHKRFQKATEAYGRPRKVKKLFLETEAIRNQASTGQFFPRKSNPCGRFNHRTEIALTGGRTAGSMRGASNRPLLWEISFHGADRYHLAAKGRPHVQTGCRVFQTSPRQVAGAVSQTLQRIDPVPAQILGAHGEGTPLVQAVEKTLRMEGAVRQMVRRRPDQSQLQLPRPPSRRAAPQQGGHHLGGRTRRVRQSGRDPRPHLHRFAPRSLPVRQCAETQRRHARRPRHHLHADGARSGHRHAGLRPHRRDALGGLRRIQRAGAHRPHSRLRGQNGHHGGWRLPARADHSVEEERR